jgi:hypothetical protein
VRGWGARRSSPAARRGSGWRRRSRRRGRREPQASGAPRPHPVLPHRPAFLRSLPSHGLGRFPRNILAHPRGTTKGGGPQRRTPPPRTNPLEQGSWRPAWSLPRLQGARARRCHPLARARSTTVVRPHPCQLWLMAKMMTLSKRRLACCSARAWPHRWQAVTHNTPRLRPPPVALRTCWTRNNCACARSHSPLSSGEGAFGADLVGGGKTAHFSDGASMDGIAARCTRSGRRCYARRTRCAV